MGIGRRAGARAITDHVLGRFRAAEAARMDEVLTVAGEQVECWLDAGVEKAMNEYNGAVGGSGNEESKQ